MIDISMLKDFLEENGFKYNIKDKAFIYNSNNNFIVVSNILGIKPKLVIDIYKIKWSEIQIFSFGKIKNTLHESIYYTFNDSIDINEIKNTIKYQKISISK